MQRFPKKGEQMSREVTTHRLALRLARKLRKEAGLEQHKYGSHGPVSARGLRGTREERQEYLDRAMQIIRERGQK